MNRAAFSLLYTFIIFILPFPVQSQPAAPAPGRFLVALPAGHTPDAVIQRHNQPGRTQLSVGKKVADFLNVWLLEQPLNGESPEAVLAWLRRQPEVRMAQYDYPVEARDVAPPAAGPPTLLLPDDPLLALQWQYVNTGMGGGLPDADLDAEAAWAITPGGVSAAGDTIVVAVIDRGVDGLHPDLALNMWINHAELPNDNIDNDANGYVDDYRGWNVYTDTDNIAGQSMAHGTPVAGIIGARGNNTMGITGVNWRVKIMFVAGSGFVSDILASYDYVLKARQRYNATQGAQGAFVVAVNSSFGINYGQPADQPLWCAAFDSLGAAGIVGIGATANLGIDVDLYGDLPTTCPSDYLISVTTLNNADVKPPGAGWGVQNIDLGAYGTGVYTLATNGGYAAQSGTSFAAPHVAGAVGLLFGAPCPNLIGLAHASPAAAALWARELVLTHSQPNASLSGLTLTGARLNLGLLLEGYQAGCSTCPAPFVLHTQTVTDSTAQLAWSVLPSYAALNLRWRMVGAATWNVVSGLGNTDNFMLTGLQACTGYEFSVQAICAPGDTSTWAFAVGFQTDGCCLPPQPVSVAAVTESTALIQWPMMMAASGYDVVWVAAGGATQMQAVAGNSLLLTGLEVCTDYTVRVRAHCLASGTITAYSPDVVFATSGCGACADASYCLASGSALTQEWIASVQIGAWSHTSGSGGGGYQDFTADAAPLYLEPGTTVPITLTPAFAAAPFKEYYRVYIDYNGNGDFLDADELAFDSQFGSEQPVSGLLVVPFDVANGAVRMRILMKYYGPGNTPPQPCQVYQYGQVEDYCVSFESPPVATDEASGVSSPVWRLSPQPAVDHVVLQAASPGAGSMPAGADGTLRVTAWNAAGQRVYDARFPAADRLEMPVGFLPAGVYLLAVEAGGAVSRMKLVKQ